MVAGSRGTTKGTGKSHRFYRPLEKEEFKSGTEKRGTQRERESEREEDGFGENRLFLN